MMKKKKSDKTNKYDKEKKLKTGLIKIIKIQCNKKKTETFTIHKPKFAIHSSK
jgi:hypothetical protein